jgi:hypothetical protein
MARKGDDSMREELTQTRRHLERLTHQLERLELSDYAQLLQLLQRPWRMIGLNLLFGTIRGVGIALGFTLLTSLLVIVLNWIGALDIPIVGDYIADIVHAVQQQLEGRKY